MEDQVTVTIDRLNARGWGVGPYLSGLVEVIGTLPGDEVQIQLRKKRRAKRRGDLLSVSHPSPERVEPRCPHVPLCGGCTWQQMDYGAQLKEKTERIKRLFAPLLHTQTPDFHEITPCADPWGYRNKMEFSFSSNRAGERFLGLIIAGSKGHVLNLTQCHLVSPWFLHVLTKVRLWWEQSSVLAYRLNDTGSLRTLTVREGKHTGDKMVMLTVSGNPAFALHQAQLDGFVQAVLESVPEEERERLSIFLRIQQIHKGAPTQFFEMHLHGPDHIIETLTLSLDKPVQLRFKISPTSFFQPNTAQAERLYSLALNMVSFPKKQALDLYAGTATLGMAIAMRAEKVTAIEINPHACFDAESNKALNNLTHLQILCGDVGKTLGALSLQPDLVVVDPPRVGLDPSALAHLKALAPEEILYVSCNPETQVANLTELILAGYRLIQVQPVDQFPHTPHIENIALLRRSQ